MKQKTRKQAAAALIVTSAPLLYYGFSNFEAGASEPLKAIAISLGCTGGLGFFFGGIYMLFKKGRGENLLASQTSEDPPILDKAKIKRQNQKALKEFADKIRKETKEEIINKKQKGNEMAKAKDSDVTDALEEFRTLGELIAQKEKGIKKDTLDVKTATERRAVLKDNLARNKTVQELLAIIEK